MWQEAILEVTAELEQTQAQTARRNFTVYGETQKAPNARWQGVPATHVHTPQHCGTSRGDSGVEHNNDRTPTSDRGRRAGNCSSQEHQAAALQSSTSVHFPFLLKSCEQSATEPGKCAQKEPPLWVCGKQEQEHLLGGRHHRRREGQRGRQESLALCSPEQTGTEQNRPGQDPLCKVTSS